MERSSIKPLNPAEGSAPDAIPNGAILANSTAELAKRIGPRGFAPMWAAYLLTPGEMVVYAALWSFASSTGDSCFPGMPALAVRANCSLGAAKKAVRRFVDLKIVTKTPQKRDNGSDQSNTYTLAEICPAHLRDEVDAKRSAQEAKVTADKRRDRAYGTQGGGSVEPPLVTSTEGVPSNPPRGVPSNPLPGGSVEPPLTFPVLDLPKELTRGEESARSEAPAPAVALATAPPNPAPKNRPPKPTNHSMPPLGPKPTLAAASRCPDHIGTTLDTPCRACGEARRAHATAEADHVRALADWERQRAAWNRALRLQPMCEGHAYPGGRIYDPVHNGFACPSCRRGPSSLDEWFA